MGAIRETVTVKYKGQSYECTPNFRFIERIEQRVNIALFEAQANAGTLQFKDVAWILYAALKEHNKGLDYYEVGDEYLNDMEGYAQVCGELIRVALKAEPIGDSKKKPKGEAD